MSILLNKNILVRKMKPIIVGAVAVVCFILPHITFAFIGDMYSYTPSITISNFGWGITVNPILSTNVPQQVTFYNGSSPSGSTNFQYQLIASTSAVLCNSSQTYNTGTVVVGYMTVQFSGCPSVSSGDYISFAPTGLHDVRSILPYVGGNGISPNYYLLLSSTIQNDFPTRFTGYSLSTSTQMFTVNGYINPNDLNNGGIHISFNLSTPNYPSWDQSDIVATTSGNFTQNFIYQNFSTSSISNYLFDSKLYRSTDDPFGSGSTTLGYLLYDEVSTTTTPNGLGTTTAGLTSAQIAAFTGIVCNPFSGSVSTLFYNTNFSISNCFSYLLYPSPTDEANLINTLKNGIATHFPLGYVYDFVVILSTTTQSSIPIINAIVPPGIPGAGASIHLDLAHSLDFVLNATSSGFSSGTATSTQTLYQITSYYWDIIIYIMTAVYILTRLLGSHVIPKFNHLRS